MRLAMIGSATRDISDGRQLALRSIFRRTLDSTSTAPTGSVTADTVATAQLVSRSAIRKTRNPMFWATTGSANGGFAAPDRCALPYAFRQMDV